MYANTLGLSGIGVRPPLVTACFDRLKASYPGIEVPVTIEKGLIELDKLMAEVKPKKLPAEEGKAPTGEEVIAARGLEHTYSNGLKALDQVDLSVKNGEYLLIAGQNGAGKSTLVKHFLGLLKPTGGEVVIGGAPTASYEVSDLAKRIGYVAQNPDNQIFNTSVEKEVSFALRNLKYPEEETSLRVDESLSAMDLSGVRGEHPLSLPRGDRARVVIAAILALRPEIIILDEPTTGQDYKGAKFILDVSKKLNEMGKTIIVVTHHLYLMPDYASRVVIIKGGRVVYDAPVRDAFYNRAALESSFLYPIQTVELGEKMVEAYNDKGYSVLNVSEFLGCFQ